MQHNPQATSRNVADFCLTKEGQELTRLVLSREESRHQQQSPRRSTLNNPVQREHLNLLKEQTLARFISKVQPAATATPSTTAFSAAVMATAPLFAPSCPMAPSVPSHGKRMLDTHLDAIKQHAQHETTTVLQQLLAILPPPATSTSSTLSTFHDRIQTMELQTKAFHHQAFQCRVAALQQRAQLLIRSTHQSQRLLRVVKRLKLNASVVHRDRLIASWLQQQFQEHSAKHKVSKLTSINRVYNKGTVPSLIRQRMALDLAMNRLTQETKQIEEEIGEYKFIDNAELFQAVAREFVLVRNDVMGLKYAIEQITSKHDGVN